MPASTADLLKKPPQLSGSDLQTKAAIYVHWPFCERKCPYCDFNSHVREQVDQKAWRTAMLMEIDTFAAKFPNLRAKSIFFGGGTPSLMPPETTAAIIEQIKKHWHPDYNIEVTLEANPSSIEAARFRDYAQAGVNRVSVGVQSLKDSSLKFLGRLHSASEALAALDIARDNFDRVSFDMIYALPDQSLEEWQTELQQALSFSPSHLSLYQLTIEEGTAFYHQYKRGKFTLPDEELAAAMFDITQDITKAAGLPAYEISNHAKCGEESQHNLAYWQGDPYVGIGPGAHGRLPSAAGSGAVAHMQTKRPEDWLNTVKANGVGIETLDQVDADERAVETIMMSLRLKAGIDTQSFAAKFNKPLTTYIDHEALTELINSGHMEETKDHLRTTAKGRPLLNFLLQKLVA
ncbi:radical SAM family heme chaperone HemW [Kordiimonas aquimaris]|uniref:radical SAM family heme chaperone HemW n=1 Tax=Kordiimonas aquimaris TaxID=707591 RepID=UPI0021D382A9|nr:radical SAM family heme chaperone HemW [Kordiimonas aquimaris]